MSPNSTKPRVKSDIFNDNPENIPPKKFDGINIIVGVNLDQFCFLLIILNKVIDSVGGHLLIPVEVRAILRKARHLRNKTLRDLVGNSINFYPTILPGINHIFSNPHIKSMKLLYEFGYTSLLELSPDLPLLFSSLHFTPWLSSNPFFHHCSFWLN